MIDRLNDIAKLSVLRGVLTDLDPDGIWKDEPLYVKWSNNRYSLSVYEFQHLIHSFDCFRIQAEYTRFSKEKGFHATIEENYPLNL